jgi:membrane fusion protein (multidrug efflux system)
MTAFFDFRFKKKPVDFSKMKDSLTPADEKDDKKDKAPAEPPPEKIPEDKPRPERAKEPFSKIKAKRRPLPKILILLLLLVILIGLLIFVVGPKYKPELMEKLKVTKVLEKLKLKKPPAEEGLITPEEEAVEELVTVRTYRIVRSDFVDVLPGMGTIKGDREVELRFSTNGIIDSINFFEGDMVRKQDIIATLEQKDQLLKLEYAKSKLKTQETAELAAKKKLEIHQSLYDQGIIIKAKLEEVQLEYEGSKSQTQAAQKEVEFALAELGKTYLYSPIDGVMGTRDAEVGEFVTSSVKVASLYDTTTVIAEMGVIEKDISRISLGQKAKINVDTYPGVDFEGKIENIAPIIEGKSRTLTVKIRIKNDNPKGTLFPGMFARIWISVYEKRNTIKLPYGCAKDLNGDGEFDTVYVVGSDNIAKARPIKIGYGSPDYIEVLDGLREGEQVVSEAMAELKDGVKVDVIEVQEPTF